MHIQSSHRKAEAVMRRLWAALLGALMLSGCFTAAQPLFDASQSHCPFAAAETYVTDDNPPARYVFAPEGPACRIADEEGHVTHALFIPLGRDRWIVQREELRPTYSLLRRRGPRRFLAYLPQCHDFRAAQLRRQGVTFDADRQTCTVTAARQVETLFRDSAATRSQWRVYTRED